MALPTITVNLGELLGEEGEPETLADNIVREGARQLVQSVERDLKHEVKEQAKKEMSEQINALIREQIDKAFSEELRETDSYGSPRSNGKSLTLNELILQKTREYLQERVSRDGRSDYGDRNLTRIQWIALNGAEQFVKTELEPAVSEAKSAVKKAIGDKLSEAFKEALRKSVECVC